MEEATRSEGVNEVHLGVHDGDVIRHIVNRPERDALGYVLASATRNRTAAENAERARACIRIETGGIH